MNLRSILLLPTICFFLLNISTLCHGEERLESSSDSCISTPWPHELSELQPDPDIRFGRLDNGFRYVLMKNQYPEGRTALFLDINAGSLHEMADEQGIAHFLEHMVFNGSTNFGPGELIDYFQDIGMSFGGDTNGYTTYEDTVYKIILPKSGDKLIAKGLLVMSDYSRGAILDADEIDRERDVVLAEMNERLTASFRSYKARTSFSYGGTLLPERLAIGDKSILEQADRRKVKQFYDKWYRPDNMVLVMVGDFDQKRVVDLISAQFGPLVGADEPFTCPEYGAVNHAGVKSFYHYEPELGYTSVSIESIKNKVIVNDSKEFQIERLYQFMAAMIINHRLEEELEKPGSVLSSARLFLGTNLNRYQYASITGHTSGEKWRETLGILNRVLSQALTYGFSSTELERVKKELLRSLDNAVITADTRDSVALAKSILDSLNDNLVFLSAVQEKELFEPVIAAAEVGIIHDLFKESWGQDIRLVEVIGNAKIDDNQGLGIKKEYLDLQKNEIIATEETQEVRFPYLELNDDGKEPIKSEPLPIADANRFVYENGIVLNLKKTTFKKNSISVAVNFGEGEKTVPKGGLALLAESVVNRSGTGRLKETELSRVLSGYAVQFGFKIEEDTFSLLGHALAPDIEILFQVLRTLLLDPGMRSDVYQSSMKDFGLMYQRLKGDMNGSAMLLLAPFFSGNTITHGLVDEAEFKMLRLEEVRQWLLPVFQYAPLEINVVGDIQPSEIVRLTSRYFGSLPERTAQKTRSYIKPQFPRGLVYENSITLQEDKGMIQTAWLIDDGWDIKKARRIYILARIVGDRLRKLVREESGASYSPAAYGSLSRIYPHYGRIITEVMTNRSLVDSVVDQIDQVVRSLHDEPVTEEELERSRKPAVTSMKDRIRTNEYWLSNVLGLSTRYPEQFAWSRTVIDDLESISLEDMNKMIAAYMNNEHRAIGIIRSKID